MEENKSENNTNKTPSKMARLAWPKAKYGAIIAVLIIIVSLTAGTLVPKGDNALPLVLSSTPTNLYWFTTAINLKRDF